MFVSLRAAGLRPGPDGGSGLVQEVHALWKRQRPDAGLGPVLPRVQTHLQTAATGESNWGVTESGAVIQKRLNLQILTVW